MEVLIPLSVPGEADADRVFAALSEGGTMKMPLTNTFWSPRFGMVADRFGLGWMMTVMARGSFGRMKAQQSKPDADGSPKDGEFKE